MSGRQFERLVIVNRGEAAMRCVRAVKALRAQGERLTVIALYTEADRDAPFVRHADEAVALRAPVGGSGAVAYLDREGVIEALGRASAEAVWPGWGFLAEDPVFVERLQERGIRFLGPGPEAMRAVGDKILAKRLAERAGVPVPPWSGCALDDEAEAERHAREIGFPVILKAAAGGGGRGIRLVEEVAGVAPAFRSASSEAKAAFGDGRLFVEKYVTGSRHVEVQIAADAAGEVRSLGCRDCSVQRRHQKLLEEAPPADLPGAIREAMESAAVRIGREAGYEGVGTVEFLVGEEGFHFLEVNPRLQVEHGITEEITGLDLVQLQIQIARGEPLPAAPLVERGVAIEARVCAEDPDQGFLPAPGRIVRFEAPLGARVRVDSGVSEGSVVPPDFDSLVAKVIATGETRDEARARLVCALRDFELVIEGGATNKGYLLELLESDDLRAGAVDTGWLGRYEAERQELRPFKVDEGVGDALVAAAILAYQRTRAAARINFYIDTSRISADRIPPSRGQQIDLSRGGESYRLEVYAIGSWRYRVHLEGQAVAASMREEGKHAARLRIDGRARRILYDAGDLGLRVEVDGHPYRFGWQSAGKVRAGTPAMVVAVHVRPGDRVEAGQALGLLEAMKTEIAFQAPVSGVVTEVCVQSGQQVAAGEVLLVIDSMGDPHGEGAETARLALPVARDPLALLFRPEAGDPLAVPDLAAADAAPPAARRDAIDTVREEIRRVLLGYDANPSRGERLVAFLEEPLPEGLSDEFQRQLAEIRFELATFADIGQLFIRAPRASVSGELGPSNNARFRMYVRRLHAAGSGIAEEFLDLVGRALSHYGASSLEPGDALERAVLRLLASQLEPELRSRLVLGVIRRVTALAGRGVDLSADATLAGALRQIAGMRGLVPHDLADAAIEARYVIFEQPRLDRDAEQTSSGVQSWMAAAEREPTPPPAGALVELAALPRRVFHRIGRWLGARDDRRTEIAVAAHVQRLYAPQVPTGHISHELEGSHIHCAEYPELGAVLAAAAGADDLLAVAGRLCQAAERIRGGVHALELFLTDGAGDTRQTARRLERALAGRPLPARLTLSMAGGDGADEGEWVHCCFEAGGGARRLDCLDLHPEIADRIDLRRLEAFELERLPSEDGIYSFYGQSREVPGDERVFVLADVRGASPLAGREAAAHLPAFERSFYQATRSLRTILQRRDPRRRLQWNRLALFVSPEIYLDAATALDLSRRLAPLTRHLGLEKVIVRLKVLDRESPNEPARTVEIVIADPTGHRMELSWRAVHRDPLQPAQDYERRVVEARRRRLVYPYEIIRLLTAGEQALSDGESAVDPLPPGGFEEYDLDPDSAEPRAIRVAGRPPGQNQAALVFGVISTPTAKVPEGMRRVLVLSDPTMGMGALAAPECDRLVAAIDLAESLGLPVEWLPVSSGARIAMDSGTENLDATARVVRRIVTFTQRGGVIHVVLQGVNVGAQTYFDALATMLMHTRGVLIMTPGASMVLTGRSALEASGAVSAEDEEAIGGFERVMGPNGQAQYYASSLPEAYAMLYDHYRYTYVVPGESSPRRLPSQDPPDRSVCDSEIPEDQAFGFATVGEIFDDETNPGRKHPFAMRTVMSALVDCDGGHLERWRPMVGAETAIVWDAHLGGFPVVLIGIESHALTREGYRPSDGPETWTGGTLFPLSSKKVARAINAASGNRPVVILANLSGFDGSPESLRKLQLEYGAEIATAVVNFQGPLLFLVVSRYHGGAYVVFSHELNDSLSASALEGSYASVIGGGPAAAVVFSREVRARTLADPRVQRGADESLLKEVTLEKQTELASEFDRIHTVERAQRVGSLEAIVPAARMRPFLIQSLEEALGSGR